MAGEPNPQTTFTQVSATAVASQGRWLICLVGAPEISVEVRRLADVDRAMAEILARDLGRARVDARVHIRWYDAPEPLPWRGEVPAILFGGWNQQFVRFRVQVKTSGNGQPRDLAPRRSWSRGVRPRMAPATPVRGTPGTLHCHHLRACLFCRARALPGIRRNALGTTLDSCFQQSLFKEETK
jgi:hypothetical protein